MRNLAIALATTAAVVASPAMARDGAWYIGGEFGGMIAEDMDIDIGAVHEGVRLVGEFVEPLPSGRNDQLLLLRHALDQRSVSASLAPSMTKAAAKVRRIQAITAGRLTTRSRIAAANTP